MLWLKAFHIMAVVAWFAGLFYLPRLFVYHADAKPGSELSETLKVMEYRLLTAIMTPAMAAVWILGLTLAYWEGAFSDGWLHAKLALVFLLSGFQGALSRWTRTSPPTATPARRSSTASPTRSRRCSSLPSSSLWF